MKCLHRMTFLSKFAAKTAVSRSTVVEAYWNCPKCKMWVADVLDAAPAAATESVSTGIFTNQSHQNS